MANPYGPPAPAPRPLDTGAFPNMASNRQDAHGQRTAAELARAVAETHRRRLQARRYRDLTCEKYILHIDGEGDNQWADILHGTRVAIPRLLSEYRRQENLLRPVVDNMVAHHTTMPMHFAVHHKPDRESRERARIDAALVNHGSRTQQWNSLFAQGLYMAAATGFVPLHAYWRDDDETAYEPIYHTPNELEELAKQLGLPGFPQIRRGTIDCWVGNPFDHAFNPGARRGSIQDQTYGRVLPLRLVQQKFDHIPAARSLHGSTRLPSASAFQRIVRAWYYTGVSAHGTAALIGGEGLGEDEELIAVVCREWAPGVLTDFPDGRLVIVALQGSASSDPGDRSRGAMGEPILLADMPLPARRFSSVLLYSHWRQDDVHGKPFVSDLDDDQVQLNIALSDRREWIQRALRAPTFSPAPIMDDTAEYNGYEILELEPLAAASFQPRVLELPNAPIALLNRDIEELREGIFRKGGWQAASRGESRAGDPAAKVVALQRADDSIHGPTNLSLRQTGAEYAQLYWALFKQYGDVPWILDVVGDDAAHLAGTYVDRTHLSETPPTFRMVSLAGSTPEAKAQQLLDLVGRRGADGAPLLRTDEFRKLWPDQDLYDEDADPLSVQKRRAQTINKALRELVQQYRQQTGFDRQGLADPWVRQAAYKLWAQAEELFPRLRDDLIETHIAALSELTQDETEDSLVRVVAIYRQEHYYATLEAQQHAMMAAAAGQSPPRSSGGGREQGGRTGPPVARASQFGGTANSEAMSPERLQRTVNRMTQQAGAGTQ